MTDAPAIKQNANGIWMLEGEQLWDSDLLPIILEHINPGDTVIDAGAWIGGHAMAYAKKVGNDGLVWAVEPNPFAFQCLKRNLDRYLNTKCDQIALGDEFQIVTLSAKKGWYDSGYVSDSERVAEVRMSPLDDYNIEPNFIKIDVEGCELKVLKGAAKTIEKHRPIIVLEINRPALSRQGDRAMDVFNWLSDNRYKFDPIETYTNQDVYNIICNPR